MTSPIHSANIPGRTHCFGDFILQSIDSTCQKTFYQGPCGHNQHQRHYCNFIGDYINSDKQDNNAEKDETKEDVDEEVSALSLLSKIQDPSAGQRVKRVYDIIPRNRGLLLDGLMARNMKVGNCGLDSKGKCRKKFSGKKKKWEENITEDKNENEMLYVKKRSPKRNLN